MPTQPASQIDPTLLRQHVERLSVPRPTGSDALADARRYVGSAFAESGWQVDLNPFEAIGSLGEPLQGINLTARHPRHPSGGGPLLCVGAHVDSRPESPGADDNASAVATLLELARVLPGMWPAEPRCGLELVAFDLEENGMLGGAWHAQRHRAAGTDLRGMVSLEMLGYCDHTPGSQSLPRALIGLYPTVGNFIAVIGNQVSGPLIDRLRTGLTRVPGLPVETLQVPDNGNLLQATRLSDHSPFWDAGYAAVMLTDTSFLRNPHYHLATDTPETLDYIFLHRVAQGSLEAVLHILKDGL